MLWTGAARWVGRAVAGGGRGAGRARRRGRCCRRPTRSGSTSSAARGAGRPRRSPCCGERLSELPGELERHAGAACRGGAGRGGAAGVGGGAGGADRVGSGCRAGSGGAAGRVRERTAAAQAAIDAHQAARESTLDIRERRLLGMAAELAGGLATASSVRCVGRRTIRAGALARPRRSRLRTSGRRWRREQEADAAAGGCPGAGACRAGLGHAAGPVAGAGLRRARRGVARPPSRRTSTPCGWPVSTGVAGAGRELESRVRGGARRGSGRGEGGDRVRARAGGAGRADGRAG